MTALAERTCQGTGLRLAEAAGETGFRVAKDRYGAVSARRNEVVGALSAKTEDHRGRFDTVGSTIYFADSPGCAYAEVLAGFRLERAKVAEAADSIGMDREEYVARVRQEALENGRTVPWAISVDWQMQRSIYQVQLPRRGYWVVIDHPDTMAVLEAAAAGFGPAVPAMLTAAHLVGEDRALTTWLAQFIRTRVLDDGSEPLGISFRSKTTMGRCWAYWDRRTDLKLGPSGNDLVQLSSDNVGPDQEFVRIAEHYKLPVLGADGA